AESYRTLLADYLPIDEIPPLRELEAHLLLRDVENFGSWARTKGENFTNPLAATIPAEELRDRLESLEKRSRYLRMVSGWDFDDLQKFADRRFPDNGKFVWGSSFLPSTDELARFFFDREKPDAFFKWASGFPKLIRMGRRAETPRGYDPRTY